MSEPKKAPCIDVRTDVHKDERFKTLAELAGHVNYYESLGRMHALWSWCRDRGLKDTREGLDGYVVHEAIVRRFIGPNGGVAILAVIEGQPIDDLALAVRLEDGMLYLRGTSEYVAAARAHAATSSAGGRARAEQARSNGERDRTGRFVSEPTNVQPEPSREPAAQPAASQQTPASSSSLSPLPPSQSQTSHAPRAIPLSPGYDPDSPADRLKLTVDTYTRIAEARDSVIAEFGLRGEVPMPAARAGMPSEPAGVRDLRERIRGEGAVAPQACDRVVDNLLRQAREERSVEWLSDKAFTEGGWRHARNGSTKRQRAATPARTGAIGSATPRTDHGTSMRPAKEVM